MNTTVQNFLDKDRIYDRLSYYGEMIDELVLENEVMRFENRLERVIDSMGDEWNWFIPGVGLNLGAKCG